MLYLRYKKGGQEFAVDAVDEVTTTVSKIGSAIGTAVSSAFGWLSKVPDALKPLFASATATYGLPDHLLEAVAYRESRFNPQIMSGVVRSAAGALGVMQILPSAHPELGEAGALDPARAIPYAAAYLAQLAKQFGDWKLALAAYNWGPGHLAQWVQAVRANPQSSPPSWPSETRDYVAEISSNVGLA